MVCINPNDSLFKEILKNQPNPLLAELEYEKLQTDTALYSQYLGQNPNINPILQGNQEEQVRMSDRIDVSVRFDSNSAVNFNNLTLDLNQKSESKEFPEPNNKPIEKVDPINSIFTAASDYIERTNQKCDGL